MPTVEEQVVIFAPIGRVFARIAEPERGPEWTPNLLHVERTSDVETVMVANVGGRESRGIGRCLEAVPPHRLVLYSALDVGITSTTTFSLAESPHGTLLSARVDYTLPPSGLGRLVGGLFGDTFARRDLRKALANLKAQLEAETPRG